MPEGSRASINKALYGRITPSAQIIADHYVDTAQHFNLDPSQLAIAFCLNRPFMGSVIIGATTQEQLLINLKSKDVKLNNDIEDKIFEIYSKNPVPF